MTPIRRIHIKLINLLIFISIFSSSHSQEKGQFFSSYHSPLDYLAGNQNWSIAQDKRGLLYIGNGSGILEYDGTKWKLIQNKNNSSIRSLAIDSNNKIYAGGYNEFGYLIPDKSGELVYKSLVDKLDSNYRDFGENWSIHCFSDTVFFLSRQYLFRYINGKFDYWKNSKERFYFGHNINGNYYIQEIGNGLLKFENNDLVKVPKTEYFKNIRIHNILPYGEDDLIICSRTKGLYLYEKTNGNYKVTPISDVNAKARSINNFLKEKIFYHGTTINDSTYALGTISGEVLIIDNKWNIKDIINQETVGVKSAVHFLHYDTNNDLWIAHANGISQVDILSPFRFWNNDKGVYGTLTDVARINNYFYVSTGSGVFYSDNNKTSEFELNQFFPVEGTFEQAWSFLYYQPKGTEIYDPRVLDRNLTNRITTPKTVLLVSTSRGIFEIRKNKSKLISKYKSIFLAHQSIDPNYLYLGLGDGVAMLSYNNGNWIDHGKIPNIEGIVGDIEEDKSGNLWISVNYKGVYKVINPKLFPSNQSQIEFYDTTSNIPSIRSVFMEFYKDTVYFISQDKLYTYNKSNNLFKEYIIPEVITPSDTLEDTVLTQTPVANEPIDTLYYLKLQGDLLTEVYLTDHDDLDSWFGTTKGVCRFQYNNWRNYSDIYPAMVRQVLSNDSLIFKGTNYRIDPKTNEILLNSDSTIDIGTILDYKDNSLTFFYSAPLFEGENQTKYSYFLEGFDKKWSDWTTETKKEYTNLREKEYIFKVKAKSIYDVETSIGAYKFQILPPWYRHFSAFIAYIIIGIFTIIIIVKLYTKRLIKEKDKLEKIVIERTQEILMQKEEILVQAEHLKEANQGITAKNEELEKQKWEITNQAIKLKKANVELQQLSKVASETDNAIGIFDKDGNIEWVNEGFTRMYGYTLDQYKEERNSNIFDSSDNPNIKEAIRSCIEEKKSVVYKFKTKTRSGEEIWAQTTLTHVSDKDGNTNNLIAIDSDITDLILAEKEIAHQRDELAVSNATKNKFFRIIAHDLRNPISTLAASSGIIFNDFEDYGKEQTKTLIGELNKLSQTTYNLLENLLDWSSTEMGDISYNPEPVDMQLIVRENIDLINRKISQKNINLKLNIPNKSEAFADENMVKTIIRNLLSNAVKFTPENGEIEISTIIKNDFIHCMVKDNGVGIEEENLNKLFKIEQHYTALGLENEKGSGLGLILCKEFVEKNGGTINISSKPNKGTSIEFTLKKNLN